jgi:hypothetical protein
MFKRRTLIGRVSRLRKDASFAGPQANYGLFFDLTVNRSLRSPKVFRVCGEVWGAEQSILASRIREGSQVMVIGCVKSPDPAAMVQLPRLDLERLLEVA